MFFFAKDRLWCVSWINLQQVLRLVVDRVTSVLVVGMKDKGMAPLRMVEFTGPG